MSIVFGDTGEIRRSEASCYPIPDRARAMILLGSSKTEDCPNIAGLDGQSYCSSFFVNLAPFFRTRRVFPLRELSPGYHTWPASIVNGSKPPTAHALTSLFRLGCHRKASVMWKAVQEQVRVVQDSKNHTSIDLKPQLQRLSSVHNAIRDTRDPEPQKDAGAKAHAAASGAQRAPTIAAPASAA